MLINNIIFLFFFSGVSAVDRHDIRCRHDYIAFDVGHLECLQNSPLVKNVTTIFQQIAMMKKSCPDCKRSLLETSKLTHLLGRNTLALGIKSHDFGGFTVSMLFKNEPFLFDLWLYPTDKDEFHLREIKIHKLSKKSTQQLLNYAQDPQFSKFWTTSWATQKEGP